MIVKICFLFNYPQAFKLTPGLLRMVAAHLLRLLNGIMFLFFSAGWSFEWSYQIIILCEDELSDISLRRPFFCEILLLSCGLESIYCPE